MARNYKGEGWRTAAYSSMAKHMSLTPVSAGAPYACFCKTAFYVKWVPFFLG